METENAQWIQLETFNSAIVLTASFALNISHTDGSSACPQELTNLPSSACHWMPVQGDAYMVIFVRKDTSVAG